jgi:hypothetical protein
MTGRFRLVGVLVTMAIAGGLVLSAAPARADDAGRIKVAKGTVYIDRAGRRLAGQVGDKVQSADVVVTGPDGSVGILFADATLLSAGPDSVLAIDRFAFDSTTNQGAFEATLQKGTLAAVSGKIAKQSPEAMKVRTPTEVLGVRGTEFLVRASGPGD